MAGNVFLIGFSGTGKSVVGRKLASRLGRRFVDTDEGIGQHFGKSIARVFAEDGEASFREVERDLVREAAAAEGLVVSVGGGAAVDPTNRAAMLDGNAVVLLEASPETILRRLRGSAAEVRPLLAVADPLAEILRLKALRAEAYAAADYTVVTDERTPEEAAEEIASWLDSWTPAGRTG